ncbi:MAG TPA: DUF378 domain-containing protein [Geminicoccaceae bacterium]|nr:DUF378 domain-containing protein [Geminicoccaceae bacterium]
MKTLNLVAQILLIVGGLNWGLVGLFQFDLVAALFGGQQAALARIVYVLVGIAAIYGLYLLKPIARGTEHPHTVTR